ncbi:MAG: (Fe-S)-binding protein [Candidatus Aminicenantes bacterium]|nr:(Fe-S)-binding protein [Candidatus Aminicenantes bacterium]
MTTPTPKTDALEERLNSLTDDDLSNILAELRRRFGAAEASAAQTCIRCGLCGQACHYFLTDPNLKNLPVYKLNLVLAVYKAHFLGEGKVLGSWIGARKLDREMVREWVDSLFGRCSGCGRCTVNCTSGINIGGIIRAARGALASAGLVPPELQSTVMLAVEQGNNMGIPRLDWLDTLEWIQEELRNETGDPDARVPVDVPGANILYSVNPREPKFFPLSLLAAAKMFYAAGESWTFSSDYYDVTNYGLYSGDNAHAGLLSDRLYQAADRLKAGTLILGECGHGFNSNRWEAPEWLRKTPPVPVESVLELAERYVRNGRITLDPSRNAKRVTLHDPCNLVRLGGIVEAQRFLLKSAVSDFVEMTPNRQKNYCCGGGGGQLSMTRYARRRLDAGRLKADQIKETGAKIVVAPCHNCIDQLMDLNREYKLGVEVKTVVEVLAEAIVLPKKAEA